MKYLAKALLLFLIFANLTEPSLAADNARKAAEKANRLFDIRKFEKALERYDAALSASPSPELENIIYFNRGAALYERGEYEKGMNSFMKSLATGDEALAAKANYNIGNCKYRLSEAALETDLNKAISLCKEALYYYKQSLQSSLNIENAIYNYEFTKKKLDYLLIKKSLEERAGGKQGRAQIVNKVEKTKGATDAGRVATAPAGKEGPTVRYDDNIKKEAQQPEQKIPQPEKEKEGQQQEMAQEKAQEAGGQVPQPKQAETPGEQKEEAAQQPLQPGRSAESPLQEEQANALPQPEKESAGQEEKPQEKGQEEKPQEKEQEEKPEEEPQEKPEEKPQEKPQQPEEKQKENKQQEFQKKQEELSSQRKDQLSQIEDEYKQKEEKIRQAYYGEELEKKFDELFKEKQAVIQNIEQQYLVNLENLKEELEKEGEAKQLIMQPGEAAQQGEAAQEAQGESQQFISEKKPLEGATPIDYTNIEGTAGRSTASESGEGLTKNEAQDLINAYGRENRALSVNIKELPVEDRDEKYKDW